MKTKLFIFTIKVVKWLVISSKSSSIPVHLIIDLCMRLQKVLEHNGYKYTILYIKAVRGNLYNYLSSNPLRNPIAKTTKDGIPLVLGDLIPLIRSGHKRVIALVLTVLTATRSLKFKDEVDTSSITQPVKGDVPNITKYMSQFWKDLGYRPNLSGKKRLIANPKIYRLSNGPNGHALNTAIIDAKYIPESLIRSLTTMSPRIGYIINNMKLDFVQSFFEREYPWKVTDKGSFRRISSFPDKEGKQRTVGILDYYSQMTLKPLHTWLSRVLSKIPQDCTLDQTKFLKGDLLKSKVFYSVDLSSATDRFPIEVISHLLKAQLPTSYVDAWQDVMVGYPFDYNKHKLIYACGNPMGAYSSFNSFALTHHYIIYYCCKELGKSWKRLPYYLLGDDIVIGDKDVGDMYIKMINSLHIEISLAKTHRSEHFFEFAKRIFYKGEEISPFPISSLKECGKSVTALTVLLMEQTAKGWSFGSIPSSINSYYGIVKELPSSFRNKLERKSWVVQGVLSLVHGDQDGQSFLNEMVATLKLPLPHINMEVSLGIISNIAVEAFSDSVLHTYFDTDDQTKVPLWNSLLRLRKKWDGEIDSIPNIEEDIPDALLKTYFTDTPIVYAMYAVLKDYDDLMLRIRKMDSTGSDWSYYMRNLALPTTEKSLVESANFKLIRSVDRFSALIEERLRILVLYPSLLS